jgi:hypothetical protein
MAINLKVLPSLDQYGIKKRSNLIDGYFPAGSTVFIIGDPGCGKSTVGYKALEVITMGGNFFGVSKPAPAEPTFALVADYEDRAELNAARAKELGMRMSNVFPIPTSADGQQRQDADSQCLAPGHPGQAAADGVAHS